MVLNGSGFDPSVNSVLSVVAKQNLYIDVYA